MLSSKNTFRSALLAALPCLLSAHSFEEASQYLDLDGTFVGFIDFDGDGQEIGQKLNSLYQELLVVAPEVPPIPLDFPALFETLGYGSIRSIGLSSKEVEPGLHNNKTLFLLEGELRGLWAMYSTGLTTFTAAEMAPADATGAISGRLNFMALENTALALADQIMGPMGQSFVNQWLGQPIPKTDLIVRDLLEALSGKYDAFWLQSLDPVTAEAAFKGWLAIENAGSILPRLETLSDSLGIPFLEDESGLTADFSSLVEDGSIGLYLHVPAGGNTLVVYTDPRWSPSTGGIKLSETVDYQNLAQRLPDESMFFSYSGGFDFHPLLETLAANPRTADYQGLAKQALTLLLGDFLRPNMTSVLIEKDALISNQFAGYSYKQMAMVLPVAVVGGVSAMAIPAFQKVRTTSQEKAVRNNLRQIASAGQQYMLETGENRVTMAELLGPDKYITELIPVAGESYDDIVITFETYTISVILANGQIVSYEF